MSKCTGYRVRAFHVEFGGTLTRYGVTNGKFDTKLQRKKQASRRTAEIAKQIAAGGCSHEQIYSVPKSSIPVPLKESSWSSCEPTPVNTLEDISQYEEPQEWEFNKFQENLDYVSRFSCDAFCDSVCDDLLAYSLQF